MRGKIANLSAKIDQSLKMRGKIANLDAKKVLNDKKWYICCGGITFTSLLFFSRKKENRKF
jgi:hypothetical protein